MSDVSPVAMTCLVLLTSRYVPYNCSSAARTVVDINSAKENPARREFVFLEIITVSSFLMKFIKLKMRKAPK